MLTINRVITSSTVNSGYSELYCRSGARSVASLESGGAERWAGVRPTEKRWSGARGERSRAGSGGYRNRLERGAGFSPQYSVLCLRCRIFYVWNVRSLWVHSSSYLSWCIKRVRAVSRLDNARCALSRLVISHSQAVERAFTEKAARYTGSRGRGIVL